MEGERAMATKAETPQEMLNRTVRELKRRAGVPDLEKAQLVAEWADSPTMRENNPFMEVADVAEVDGYILTAIQVSDEALKAAPKGAPKVSWGLHDVEDFSPLAGGTAESLEQAKRFAQVAYQAAHGVILGGDA